MANKTIDISRRQALFGLGGAMVSLPILPSLMSKTAYGADPIYKGSQRLMWFAMDHGGAFESNMFPASSTLTDKVSIFSDHGASFGKLVSSQQGDLRSVSPVLTAKSSLFTEKLLSKMNVLQGLDIPFYIAHHTGGHLGNYARNNGDGNDGKAVQGSPRPTIDQMMAWSSSFYADLTSVKARSLHLAREAISWGYSSPSSQSGEIVNIKSNTSSRALFDQIFVNPSATASSRGPVIDRVLDSYKTLRNGSSRLSASDKQRLDDHIERIHELQRRLTAVSSCKDVKAPTDDANKYSSHSNPADSVKESRLYLDVAITAFMCGSSRIATLGLDAASQYIPFSGDWHQDVAHKWNTTDSQALLVKAYQAAFENVILYAASSLDVEEVPGQTYLDNTLIAWSQESGMETHTSISLPIVTLGSASGYFKTGLAVDYRRIDPKSKYVGAGKDMYMGLLYGQWLATVLLSMGLKPSEFERWGHKGIGIPFLTKDTWTPAYGTHYQGLDSRYFQMASDPLPIIKA